MGKLTFKTAAGGLLALILPITTIMACEIDEPFCGTIAAVEAEFGIDLSSWTFLESSDVVCAIPMDVGDEEDCLCISVSDAECDGMFYGDNGYECGTAWFEEYYYDGSDTSDDTGTMDSGSTDDGGEDSGSSDTGTDGGDTGETETDALDCSDFGGEEFDGHMILISDDYDSLLIMVDEGDGWSSARSDAMSYVTIELTGDGPANKVNASGTSDDTDYWAYAYDGDGSCEEQMTVTWCFDGDEVEYTFGDSDPWYDGTSYGCDGYQVDS